MWLFSVHLVSVSVQNFLRSYAFLQQGYGRIFWLTTFSVSSILSPLAIAGKYTVYEGVKLLAGLSWGIAGRNKEKLESTLAEIGKKADTDLSKTPIIIADVTNEESLIKMAERAKVRPSAA